MTWVFLKMGYTVYTLYVNWENIRFTSGIIGTLVLEKPILIESQLYIR